MQLFTVSNFQPTERSSPGVADDGFGATEGKLSLLSNALPLFIALSQACKIDA